ncbi:homeodomain transcription factor [Lithospermum erythrorhizon]|uniref:Homeodomain transcription factor n=1 Tax=Lithospermum erythrorhizon TaxID=34254 RepID=A0AAV3RZL1_LITER
MSQEFNGNFQNYFNQSNQRNWINQRNMARVLEGRELQPPPTQGEVHEDPPPVYDAAGGMLNEIINYPSSSWLGKSTNSHMLISQIHSRHGWSHNNQDQEELSLMNIKAPSPPPPPTHHHNQESLLINEVAPQFNWVSGSNPAENEGINIIENIIESRGLSLSLSSKFEELKMRNGTSGMYSLMNQEVVPLASSNNQEVIHVGYAASQSFGLLRHSSYVKATQELLDEFCCVGKGNIKNINQRVKRDDYNENPNDNNGSGSSSSLKEQQQSLSASERSDYQRRKAKFISMLDEVDARYARYSDEMKAMETSFDSVLGYGAATTYTTLARKAMSRHFRCLKDAIVAQLKLTCELLGDKDLKTLTGLTKGETPRLRLLDQKLRQQKSFNQIGMLQDSEGWRPQRGLPERSVNLLRAWLFEHFLHPYVLFLLSPQINIFFLLKL